MTDEGNVQRPALSASRMGSTANVQHTPAKLRGAMPAGPTPAAIRHIYVHIPFCARICPYCAVYKERPDSSQTQRFCEALLAELDAQRARWPLAPETIFIGGGTPTALTTPQLQYLLGGFRDRLDLAALNEWTVEANPGSVSPGKAELLRNLGVNRISLGVQSWEDELLKLLGREHNAAQAEDSFHILRRAGNTNVSIDLMFGLPGQTLAQWEATLRRTIALEPDHISTYCLTYEEGTEFFIRQVRGEFREDPDSDAGFLESAMQILESAGFEHYEISNYARAGFASSPNRDDWPGALSERLRLPAVFGPGPGGQFSRQFNRDAHRGHEARRTNRAFSPHGARNSSLGAESVAQPTQGIRGARPDARSGRKLRANAPGKTPRRFRRGSIHVIPYLKNLHRTVAAIPVSEIFHGVEEILLGEIRPELRGYVHLRVRKLPEKEV